MAFILTFVFVSIFVILNTTNSDTINLDDELETSASVLMMARPNPCEDFNCTRIRNPVCSSIGDEYELWTDINQCFYNQRVKCIKDHLPDKPVPTFLHKGECHGTECIGNAPRIYKPICSSVDGVATTDANKWLYQIKRECAKNFRDKAEKNKPIVRFLHNGKCYGNEGKCWRKCPNNKKPVCGTIDGYLTTEKNRCILNNKIRCNNMLRNQKKSAHIVLFLHTDSCDGDELKCNSLCPRSYRPVCSSVNGRLKTIDRCVLRRRIQCDRKLKKLGRKNVPNRVLKYDGECRQNSTSNKQRRMAKETKRVINI